MQLIHGDCLEVMQTIQDESTDLILCDLPYGTTANDWDKKLPFRELWERYERIIKPHGAIVLFSQMPFTAELVMSNRKLFRYEWIWEKTNAKGFLDANRKPLRAHENLLVFYKHLPKYNPQKPEGKPYRKSLYTHQSTNYKNYKPCYAINEDGKRCPRDVITFGNRTFKGGHPTQKPIAILEYIIRTYTDEGDLVMDNCMGSGSTGVACANTGRDFIGIELDNGYFGTAKIRIEEALESLSWKP